MSEYDYDLFLSYNRHDKEWVWMLATRLERATSDSSPLKVFFDEWDIAPGENIPIVLEKALHTSRKIGIIVSPESCCSAWVEMERSVAAALDPAGRQRRIIPILLRGSDNHLPSLLIPLRYIDFRDPERFEHQVRVLLRAIREEPSPRGGVNDASNACNATVREEFRERLLQASDHRCSICHTTYSIDLYRLGSSASRQLWGRDDFIALCATCRSRATADAISPSQLRSVGSGWEAACRTDNPVSTATDRLESAFAEALRLSLSTDIWDLKRARIKCQEILHVYNPFHADATLLLERLLKIEAQMEADLAARHARFRYPLPVSIPGWLTLILLPCIILEEFFHAFTSWLLGAVRNAQGRRMPLTRHLSYIEINELPAPRGVANAIRSGRVSSASYNLSKAQMDWYTEARF